MVEHQNSYYDRAISKEIKNLIDNQNLEGIDIDRQWTQFEKKLKQNTGHKKRKLLIMVSAFVFFIFNFFILIMKSKQ